MTNYADKLGWDAIWRNRTPNRFKSSAAPNGILVEWANELTPGGLILDIGCGVGRHCVYMGGLGFRMVGLDIFTQRCYTDRRGVCSTRHFRSMGAYRI